MPADNRSHKLRTAIIIVVPTSILLVFIGSTFFQLGRESKVSWFMLYSLLLLKLLSISIVVISQRLDSGYLCNFILDLVCYFYSQEIAETCLANGFPIQDYVSVVDPIFSREHQRDVPQILEYHMISSMFYAIQKFIFFWNSNQTGWLIVSISVPKLNMQTFDGGL